MRSDREKAEERTIDGPYKELAIEIRRLLGYYSATVPLLSSRQAALKSGVNHATISGLVNGARASRETLKLLTETFGGDLNKLFRLAGYAIQPVESAAPEVRRPELQRTRVADGLSERIYHKLERLSERDLQKLDKMLEVWVDDDREVGT